MNEELLILLQIIFIDLVLAGDNAVIIGMVASQFEASKRKKIIFWGIGAAVILRIIFTLIASYLLQINGLRLVGGLLLLYIVYKLYVDVIKDQGTQESVKVDKSSLFKAIITVMLADVTMSLDNVISVAGAAKRSLFSFNIWIGFIYCFNGVYGKLNCKMDKNLQMDCLGWFNCNINCSNRINLRRC
jgi:YjbE family integral membrane protein